jgi:uncharacterized membrane protein
MSLMMIFHIVTGTLSVCAGAIALLSRKGSRLHRAAGNVFFVSMLMMAAAGATIAFLKPQMITFLAGVFTCYLVATAWVTIRRAERKIGFFEFASPVIALAVGVAGVVFGLEAMNSASGLKDGFPAEPYFFFGGIALLAMALDINVLFRRGIAGRHRIARHIWRMSFALYIAMGSLFTGPGATAFPESIRGSALLSVPENVVALLMVIWLARVLFTKWYGQEKQGVKLGVTGNRPSVPTKLPASRPS